MHQACQKAAAPNLDKACIVKYNCKYMAVYIYEYLCLLLLLGSTTLNQWKILSIPNLDGFLEIRPGVQTRGQPLVPHFEDEIFCLSDYEEDGIPVVSQMLLDSPSRNSKTSCCNSDSSQYEPNESSRAASRRHSCIPNLTTENLYPFYDFGPRTLPDIVTRETIPIGGTQMPKPSCKVM